MKKTIITFLNIALFLAFIFVAWVYPEVPTAMYTFGILLLISLVITAVMNQKALQSTVKSRTFKYGANATISVGLVLAIVVILNVLNSKHYYRKDLTKNQSHGLSDQTIKILKDLKKDVRIIVFEKIQARDAVKGILENYTYHAGSKLKIEFVDPDRDPSRAKAVGVKKYGTVILQTGGDKETLKETRVEEVNEEKLTNGLIKLLKDKNVTICFTTGHGEKLLDVNEAEGLSSIKQELQSQTYDAKTINLMEEGKIADNCTVVAIVGANKGFFEKELNLLSDYLKNGGNAFLALDPNLKGNDFHPELTKLLSEWYIEVKHNLVLDPTSRLLGQNAAVPLIAIYNKDHPITKEAQQTSLFPLTSTVEIKNGAPATLKVNWLAKSTPRSFAMTDFKSIATGQVKIDEKKEKADSFPVMAVVEGKKDAKAPKDSRIIVMGTSGIATNGFSKHGANLDLVLNALSWLSNDDSLISIRPKEEASQPPTLSQAEGRVIQLITKYLIPLVVIVVGIVLWVRRRRL